MTVTPRGSSAQHAASANALLSHSSSAGSIPGEMDETDAVRFKRVAEDAVSLAPSTTESIIVEDAYYAAVRAELDSDAQDLEVESWSLAVDQQHLKKHSKEMIKRQDVIYELIQTEMHHVRTLKIMLRVYVRELREALQMDDQRLDCLFPRLESLLHLHTHFLSRLRERRRGALQPGNERNYSIQRLGDILISQFSGEMGDRMKESYGDFCSHQSEAVSCYKEQLQSNKKFQNLIRKISNLSIVRRLGVPECILLVTQRITKYPVLVERILQNTEVGTEEQEELTRALALIKDTIVAVDKQVDVHEKATRLGDIAAKLEPKSLGKFKDGRVFRGEDVVRRNLLHHGTVNSKAASGRLKDIVAVLLSDVLLLLQEKDQRYIFSTVDSKPSVISLQKLIVREVAHEEKAMFLICAYSSEPEMYEIHTSSKEERNTWMNHIRQAVESCPHTEERLFSEEEEAARTVRFKAFQERLSQKDAQIAQGLTEKLQLFAELAESVAGLEDAGGLRSRLLLRGDASDLQQGEQLLKGAITEVENLQNLLLSGVREPAPLPEESQGSGALPRRADTFGGYDSTPSILDKNGSVRKKRYSGAGKSRERSQRARSDPQLKEICASQELDEDDETNDEASTSWNPIWSNSFPEAEFFDQVLMLSQRLYSLQAIISQQDSHIELQRASLTVHDRPGNRHRGSSVLLEQEKQRSLALQREEQASFNKRQTQHKQEHQRWERERDRHRLQAEAAEDRLTLREEECRRLEARLAEEREELERQREEYQQDLERLRESTRAVEREKERLEQQRKLKKHNTLPSTVFSQELPLSSSFNGELLMGGGDHHALPPKSLVRSSLSVAPADYLERPEAPPPRREITNASSLPVKTEVPIHLISTTNQLHKQAGVQQQIPTKLAALSKGKERSGKAKSSHRTESSASVDMKQMLPLKLSVREDCTQKVKRSISPHQHHHTDPVNPPDNPPDTHSAHAASAHKPASQSSLHNLPPPSKLTEDLAKEEVIFF